MPKYRPEPERFWEKVDKNGPVPDYAPHLGPCWIWTAALDNGYGLFGRSRGGVIRAYVWAWQSVNGPRPKGLQFDHLCRVRACVRPDHLEPVTLRENLDRGMSPSTLNRGKPRCKRGHLFDEANTIVKASNGHRTCRECSNASRRVEKWGAPRKVNLTPEQKAQIYDRYVSSGLRQADIAAEFGINLSTASRTIRSESKRRSSALDTKENERG